MAPDAAFAQAKVMKNIEDPDRRKLNELVPAHLRGGLALYVEHGVMPGDFLCAVLDNRLFEAVARADEQSLAGLRGITQWLWNYAPSACFGSKEKRVAWVARTEPTSKAETVALVNETGGG